MNFMSAAKRALDHKGLRVILVPLVNGLGRWQGRGFWKITYEDGVWIHHTAEGCFAYSEPYVRLDMRKIDDYARLVFFWGYRPKGGDVIVDVGAGVGEETLTFSKAVGESGKVICIEAHPRTYRCLEKLVQHNCLKNVIPVHTAIAEPSCRVASIEDSHRYLRNRLNTGAGVPVPTTSIDAIYGQLGLGRVHFLKMNIEGAERAAIQGMSNALRHTEVVCICCHDFLAESTGDERLKTKAIVRQFLQQNGLHVVERSGEGLPPYIREQLWGYQRS